MSAHFRALIASISFHTDYSRLHAHLCSAWTGWLSTLPIGNSPAAKNTPKTKLLSTFFFKEKLLGVIIRTTGHDNINQPASQCDYSETFVSGLTDELWTIILLQWHPEQVAKTIRCHRHTAALVQNVIQFLENTISAIEMLFSKNAEMRFRVSKSVMSISKDTESVNNQCIYLLRLCSHL